MVELLKLSIQSWMKDQDFGCMQEGRNDLYYAKTVNYRLDEFGNVVYLSLVVRIYITDEYINLWVDKLWNDVSWKNEMGNGFIHMTLRNIDDWNFIVSVLNKAMLG